MNLLFIVELLASVTTIAGIYVGSTTLAGAVLYLVSVVFWYWLTFGKRLWGLMPLNIAVTIVATINVYKAFQP